jgi:DNA topoisomerase-2
MCYNPTEIIDYLKSKLVEENIASIAPEFAPYYEGFTGSITKISDGKYLIKGKYEKVGADKIRVTELPVGMWTDDFKEYLEALTESVDKNGKKVTPVVKDYDDMSKDTTIDFIITLCKGKLDELESVSLDHGCNGLEKQFKLFTTNSSGNMHLFDANDKLKKYSNVVEIIDDYFETRLTLFQVRKTHMIQALTKELLLVSNKTKYIKENLEGSIDLRRKKREEVNAMLKSKEYDVMDGDEDYKYLTRMPMDSVTEENVAKLLKEHGDKTVELNKVMSMSPQQMWFKELNKLEEEYVKFREERERMSLGIGEVAQKKKIVARKPKLSIVA